METTLEGLHRDNGKEHGMETLLLQYSHSTDSLGIGIPYLADFLRGKLYPAPSVNSKCSLYYIIVYKAILYYTILYHIISSYMTIYWTVLYFIKRCSTVLNYLTLYHVILHYHSSH